MQPPETRHSLTVARRSRIVVSATVVALALALVSAGAAAAAAPGSLVSSFGTGGSVTLPAGTQVFGVAVQSNGDVVAAGQSGGKVLVERFTPAGAPAGTYTGPAGVARGVAIQANGAIVVAGAAGASMLVERLTSAMAPDPAFGSHGLETTFAGQSAVANGVAIAPDGSIVAAGSTNPTGLQSEVAVAKFSATGTSLFSAPFNFGNDSVANGVAVQANGDIVLVGSQRPLQLTNGVIARLTPTGTLDPTFAAAGAGATTFHYAGGGYTSFSAVALQSNGQIVVAGADAGGPHALLLRYSASGVLDPSFGTAGVTAFLSGIDISVPGAPVGAYGIGIAGGGAIVGVGQYEKGGGEYDGAAWATTSGGAPQTSFGTAGLATAPTGLFENCALAVAPDGTLVAVGNSVTKIPDSSPCTVNTAAAGFVVEYTGFGPIPIKPPPPPPPPPTAALKISLKGVAGSDKTSTVAKHGLRVGVNCNEACTIKLSLVVSSGTAKRLHIFSKSKKCTKVNGKQHCKTTSGYFPVTIASGKGSLKASGTSTTTLKLNKAYVKALERQKSVSVSLEVAATSTVTHKGVTTKKSLTFKR